MYIFSALLVAAVTSTSGALPPKRPAKRPWDADPQQLHQLEEKFNAYLGYVQGGYLVREYPHYEGRDVCLALDCAEAPRGEAQAMLRAMQNFAAGEGLRFVVRVKQ